uniref:NAD(P)H-quinone oxidoreductase subunit 5, chloroplastic n=5 Tax=Antrophyum TaxID=29627 RepID=A0A3G5CTU8_9MONI|nr:NADH-plastoquinone oxidoreductase subunit 5 [Antrophyum semicostatum]AYW16293.1 NADH-plastoquinone oxidoreductase subunit 5 [Antrophyum semicostatum]
MKEYAWIIPFCPLLASCCTGSIAFFFTKATLGFRRICALLNILALTIATFVSFALLQEQCINQSIQQYLWVWIFKNNICIEIGFFVDFFTIVMSLLITTVGILVMIYSDNYMRHDRGYVRFYAYLSLFTASMLGSIFSPSLIQLYMFWELMGMCSYLLIGFWFTRSDAANACQKAFVTNRIGDFGLLLGILGLYWTTGSFEISELCDRFAELKGIGFVNVTFANIIVLLFFLGPLAKSAQFPLHIWLPDAMEGPTPISALIHAATMVAAGIFLIARVFNLILMLPFSMFVISWIGAITAFLGATLAFAQTDLKKSLAYSTMSQLGYMVLSLGIGAYRSALFHLITHALSKALLFLGAGSVIHLVEKVVGYSPKRSQNMFFMGGLRKYMPITGTTFLTGTLSLCGIPPLACFWSKDEIINASWLYSPILGLVTSSTAAFTAFYMCRTYFLTFEGDFHAITMNSASFNNYFSLSDNNLISLWGQDDLKFPVRTISTALTKCDISSAGAFFYPYLKQEMKTLGVSNDYKLRESDLTMTFPLVALSILVLFIGFLGIHMTEEIFDLSFPFNSLITEPFLWDFNNYFFFLIEIIKNSFGSLLISLIGMASSFYIYRIYLYKRSSILGDEQESIVFTNLINKLVHFVKLWSLNRGYIDHYYHIFFVRKLTVLSTEVLRFDRNIIDCIVSSLGASNLLGGESIRYLESGRIYQYLAIALFGMIILVWLVLWIYYN